MALFGRGGGASGGMKAGFRDMKWGDQPPKEMEVLDEHGVRTLAFTDSPAPNGPAAGVPAGPRHEVGGDP